jgi:hypothetical protein
MRYFEIQSLKNGGKMRKLEMFKILGMTVVLIAFFGLLVGANAQVKGDYFSFKNVMLKGNPSRPPNTLNHGGPDAGGYYYIDSDDDASNHPVFNWIDITGFGVNLGFNGDDQLVASQPIGFTFNFYGNPFTTFTACTNGWAGFSSYTTGYYNNQTIPTADAPNNLLAVMWDDMDCRTSGAGYTYTNNIDTCIIAWIDVPHYSFTGTGVYTFEIILTADGKVVYQYLSQVGTIDSYTCGIENGNGTTGLQYVYNTSLDLTGKAISFGQVPPIFASHDVRPSAFVSPTGFGRVGTPVTPVVTFQNNGTVSESFPGRLTIDHSGQVYDHTQQINNLAPATSVNITFPDYTPPAEGAYNFVATSGLPADSIPQNDTLRMSLQVFADVYFEDFEAGNGFYTGDNDWQWGNPTNPAGPGAAHSGSNVWSTGLVSNYNVGPLESVLISPGISLDPNAVLSFWQWYSTENTFDGGNVKISSDGGGTWTLITPNNGYTGVLSTAYENPIGGEEAFFGESGGWVQATFDLSAYANSSVIFKFDFGSDNSVALVGWFIDDVTVIGGAGAAPGWIRGVVSDLASGSPLNGAIVAIGGRRDTTDASGHYFFELISGSYSLTASAQYHNDLTVNGVVVVEGDTTTQNFALTAPVMLVNTTPIDTVLNRGLIATFTRSISNTGNGPLNFSAVVNVGGRLFAPKVNIEPVVPHPAKPPVPLKADSRFTDAAPFTNPDNPPTIMDFGDQVFTFDPQTPTGDVACLGVEYDGTYFWVTGRHPLDEIHKLHKFDHDGNYIESFDQGTTSTFGWRDLAFDGTYLYASDENEFAQIDPTTGQKIGTLPMPTGFAPPLRGLAYDPATDHFWTVNFASNIVEFTRTGQVIHSYANTLSAYGLAWDDVSAGGPYLWVFSQDGVPAMMISQFDPATGQYTNVSFFAIDPDGVNDDIAGGLCFTTHWNPTLGILFCLDQGTTGGNSSDMVQGYEVTPNITWLAESPSTGTIEASQSANLTITVDFTGSDIVADSIYHGSIIVTSNAPGQATIPVTARAGAVGVDEPSSGLPTEFSLSQNYPNPFNPNTSISFAVPRKSHVDLSIYDITGARVANLMNSELEPGTYRVNFDGRNESGMILSSGVYFYKLRTDEKTITRKMVFMK